MSEGFTKETEVFVGRCTGSFTVRDLARMRQRWVEANGYRLLN